MTHIFVSKTYQHTKPLSEPMLPYCELDHNEHISVKFHLKFKRFPRNALEDVICEMAAILSWPQRVNVRLRKMVYVESLILSRYSLEVALSGRSPNWCPTTRGRLSTPPAALPQPLLSSQGRGHRHQSCSGGRSGHPDADHEPPHGDLQTHSAWTGEPGGDR